MTPADIRALRDALGMTQGEFADIMGINGPAYVSAWEAGTRTPSGPAVKLMQAYRAGYRPDGPWQPIETAPRGENDKKSSFGPTILLGSDHGHRAVGYWSKGWDDRPEGWANLDNHRVMSYWKAFSRWMPLPEPPTSPDPGMPYGTSKGE